MARMSPTMMTHATTTPAVVPASIPPFVAEEEPELADSATPAGGTVGHCEGAGVVAVGLFVGRPGVGELVDRGMPP